MNRLTVVTSAILLAVACLAPAARAETYSLKPHIPCVPAPGGGCWTPVPSPTGWQCHWSMDLEGKVLGTVLVDDKGMPLQDATLCDLKACTDACNKTSGCIAVDIMKSSKIDGQWNTDNKCVCTLFGSVTSAKQFEEVRSPVDKLLSGWACMRAPKSPPPPVTEIPHKDSLDRPGFEQDRMRPEIPGTTGTPGRRHP